MNQTNQIEKQSFFANPTVGSAFTILSGLSLLGLCMILPLVGPAAMQGSGSPGAGPVPHLTENVVTFVAVLILSAVLAVCAVVSKLERRKVDGSPLPLFSISLCGIYLVLFIALVTGILYI